MYKGTLSRVFFALIVNKKFLSVNFFTLAPLLMLATNIRYAHDKSVLDDKSDEDNLYHAQSPSVQPDPVRTFIYHTVEQPVLEKYLPPSSNRKII